MNKQIVINAWELVSEFHSLKKLNFIPSIFAMAWLLLVLFYQITYTFVGIFGKKDEILTFLYSLPSHPYFLSFLIAIVGILLLYTILTPLSRGGMIHMMHSYRGGAGKKIHRSWQGFFDGLRHFLPMFELHNMLSVFAPITIITATIFLMRIVESPLWWLVWTVMGIYFIFAMVLNLMFSYVPFFVVIEEKRGIKALSASTNFAINNISTTARIFFTNILLYLRTLFVGTIFLLLPLDRKSVV